MDMNILEEFKNGGTLILLTAQDIAQMMQISKSMAYQLMQRGNIKTVKFGRSVRVRPIDLDHFIKAGITQ